MYEVVASVDIPGYHMWRSAPQEFSYLASRHRHTWVIRAHKSVSDPDREIECNKLADDIHRHLVETYGFPCEFGGMSCESIGDELMSKFGLSMCEVLEDGRNGAVVYA